MIFFKEPQKKLLSHLSNQVCPFNSVRSKDGTLQWPLPAGLRYTSLSRHVVHFGGEYMERGYASVCVSVCLREIVLI